MLTGQIAIVTGAARGIGLATAHLLAEHGARVVVSDISQADADEAASSLPGDCIGLGGDLTCEGVPEALVGAAVERWGKLDIVVNNAGYTADAPLHKMTDEAFASMLEIHATVPFRVLRAAAPHLREPAKRDMAEEREVFRKVVNITSVSGTMGNATQANYAAGKAAVVGMTKSLAKEWGPLKINVNAVAFGFMDTRLTQSLPESTRTMVEMFTPLGRVGTPQEAAGPVLFMCSPLSNYITGQVLTVSGGLPFGMS